MSHQKPPNWVYLPEMYQPDTIESRKESGLKYAKYYHESAYDAVVKELRRSGECGHGQLQYENLQLLETIAAMSEQVTQLQNENFELKARVEMLEEVKRFFEMSK